jgi:hypothetical protein
MRRSGYRSWPVRSTSAGRRRPRPSDNHASRRERQWPCASPPRRRAGRYRPARAGVGAGLVRGRDRRGAARGSAGRRGTQAKWAGSAARAWPGTCPAASPARHRPSPRRSRPCCGSSGTPRWRTSPTPRSRRRWRWPGSRCGEADPDRDQDALPPAGTRGVADPRHTLNKNDRFRQVAGSACSSPAYRAPEVRRRPPRRLS